MKLSRADIEDLRRRLRSALKKQQLTVTEIGQLANVHPSQVGRICRGEFRTMSHNVVEVCRVLGIERPTPTAPPGKRDAAWARLERSLRVLWDQRPEQARKILRVLEAMVRLNTERKR